MNKSKVVKFFGVLLVLILFIAACSTSNSTDSNIDNSNENKTDAGNSENNAADENDTDIEDTGNDEEASDDNNSDGEVVDETDAEETGILGFEEARDFLAAYFLSEYGIEVTEPWMEQNLTEEGLVGSSTIRFVSGPLTIKMSAPVVAPENIVYTIEEASYIANGFYWEGTLTYFGEITETTVMLPGTILNDELARDGVLAYLSEIYNLPAFGEWTDEGYSQGEGVTSVITYTSGTWSVEVGFEPAAPLVASYHVTVENSDDGLTWEGEISLRGEISK